MANDVKFTSNIYTLGCLKSLGDWINQHALVLGGVLLGVLLPQVFLLVLSSNLVKMIMRQRSGWAKD